MSIEHLHQRNLSIAVRAAIRGIGHVEPNPPVGCVIGTDQGTVSAIGHHAVFGGPHAEVNALASCRNRAIDPAGKTAWVTLEPCSHTGKTPPCTQALIASGIARVVYAVADPHPQASGGAQQLRDAGLTVQQVAHRGSQLIALPYLTRQCKNRPWVIGKWAQSLDGKLATRTGHSQWISNSTSRRHVHRTRACVDAILTGIGTVLADDPHLTVRNVPARRTPMRIVVDPDLRLPLESNLVQTIDQAPLLVACQESSARSNNANNLRNAGATILSITLTTDGLDLASLLRTLWNQHNVATIMTECGPGLLRSLLDASLLDMLHVYIAPIMLNDAHAPGPIDSSPCDTLADASRFTLVHTQKKRDDLLVTYMSANLLKAD